MADEPAVEETAVEEAPEGRANLAATNFMIAALQAICGVTPTLALTGQKIGLHNGVPGITGAAAVAAVAKQNLIWGTFALNGSAIAEVTATAVVFNNCPANTYTHYGVYNSADAFLYGKPLSAPVTIPAGATGTITVTAKHTYDLT